MKRNLHSDKRADIPKNNQNLIETLSTKYYNDIAADIWTMSPPCQPYTRIGLQQGSVDARAKSFLHLLKVLGEMENKPKYILVENVKGFEVIICID